MPGKGITRKFPFHGAGDMASRSGTNAWTGAATHHSCAGGWLGRLPSVVSHEAECQRPVRAAEAPGIATALTRSRRDLAIAGIVVAWITLGLVLDAGAGIWLQRALGAATWMILFALLRGEDRAVRAQTAVVVVVATAVEFTASPLLGFYTYRLDNVPAFVPPGHGLVYLAAIALGRSELFGLLCRSLQCLVLVVAAAWALWGIALADRGDAFGLLLFVLFARFVLVGRAPHIYAAAFLMTSYLELLGTGLGNWTWALYDPSGLLSIGNPPSGIPGGYCVLDAVALASGQAALRAIERAWAGRRKTEPDAAWHRLTGIPCIFIPARQPTGKMLKCRSSSTTRGKPPMRAP